MVTLTPDDVKRWDLTAIRLVFETANSRARSHHQLGEALQDAQTRLSGWEGEAGEAFQTELGKIRTDIEHDGQESRRVARAVERAEYYDGGTHGLDVRTQFYDNALRVLGR